MKRKWRKNALAYIRPGGVH